MLRIYAILVATHPDFGGTAFVYKAFTTKAALDDELRHLVSAGEMNVYEGGNVLEGPPSCTIPEYFWHCKLAETFGDGEGTIANVWTAEFEVL